MPIVVDWSNDPVGSTPRFRRLERCGKCGKSGEIHRQKDGGTVIVVHGGTYYDNDPYTGAPESMFLAIRVECQYRE